MNSPIHSPIASFQYPADQPPCPNPPARSSSGPPGACMTCGGLTENRATVRSIRTSYGHGLVESTCLSVNATWSALRFTFPKRGKTYANRYGALPAR